MHGRTVAWCGVGANCVRVTTGPRRRCAHRHDVASLGAAAGRRRLSCGDFPSCRDGPRDEGDPRPSLSGVLRSRQDRPRPSHFPDGACALPQPLFMALCSSPLQSPRKGQASPMRDHSDYLDPFRCADRPSALTCPPQHDGHARPRHSGTGPPPPLGIPPAAPPAPRCLTGRSSTAPLASLTTATLRSSSGQAHPPAPLQLLASLPQRLAAQLLPLHLLLGPTSGAASTSSSSRTGARTRQAWRCTYATPSSG